jgi:4-hydroxy 2-oxovalerate aldolase
MLTTSTKREPVILDTTIRDGSYAVNFQYDNEDLRKIIGDLDVAGIPYLEIGHGVTIGASAAQGRAAQTDEEYFRAARSVVRNAKLGAVIVPALAPIETVDLAGDYLDFLRMCVIATEFEKVTPFVERAQSKGLEVSVQLVKSHLFEPDLLARAATQAGEMGARIVYVVDTTGTFLPEDVRRYVGAVRDASDVTVGYHGHNNLGMAVANTLEAFEAGADFLDGTLMGFGRGAGNCQTESLIAALQRRGHLAAVDLDRVFEAARSNMLGRVPESYGIDPWEIAFGFHGLDSLQIEHIHTSAERANLTVSRVIREIAENIEGPWLTPEDIDRVVARMRARMPVRSK